MRCVIRIAASALAMLVISIVPLRAQTTLPDGVTQAMITEGQGLFKGAGICIACHGPEAKGIPNLGADLTDGESLHSDGSYDGIVATIKAGVSADKSSTGTVMPPKGGSALSDEQVKAVAAYVWSLSHQG